MEIHPENRLLFPAKTITWSELLKCIDNDLSKFTKKKYAVVSDSDEKLLAYVAAFFKKNYRGLVTHSDNFNENLREQLLQQGFSIIKIVGAEQEFISSQTVSKNDENIYILTSGTTGIPKIIPHTWTSLFSLRSMRHSIPHQRWLLTYLPGTYAWYQMVTMGMFIKGQDLICAERFTPEQIFIAGIEHQATSISSTPSFWRYLLLLLDQKQLRSLPLKQITLGGEPVDQNILDQIRDIYPASKITHIYASTEMGASIVVNDGKEGFPAAWLENSGTNSTKIKIINDQLHILSKHSATNLSDWYNTEDIVEIVNNRVRILGREESGIANIGGQKVSLVHIQRIILGNPMVAWVGIVVKKSPITGHIITAQIVLKKNIMPEGNIEKILTDYCKEKKLNDWMIPRIWSILDKIPLTKNMKSKL